MALQFLFLSVSFTNVDAELERLGDDVNTSSDVDATMPLSIFLILTCSEFLVLLLIPVLFCSRWFFSASSFDSSDEVRFVRLKRLEFNACTLVHKEKHYFPHRILLFYIFYVLFKFYSHNKPVKRLTFTTSKIPNISVFNLFASSVTWNGKPKIVNGLNLFAY